MRLQLAILGTSNCVGPTSFVGRIRPKADCAVRNLSLGACTSSLGLYAVGGLERADQGVALLDYADNDGHSVSSLATPERISTIESNIRSLAASLRGRGYLPIALILPHYITSRRRPLGERIYELICLSHQINLINLRSLFQRAIKRGASPELLMRDGAHMSERAGTLSGLPFPSFLT